MASFSQPPLFSSLIPIKNKNFPLPPQPKNFLAFKNSKISSSKSESSPNLQENSPEGNELDPVKLALARAKSYKRSRESGIQTPSIVQSSPQEPYAEVPGKNKGVADETLASGLKGGNEMSAGDKQWTKSSEKKGELSISSMDFMGLGFADKKSGRSLPAGLVPQSDPYAGGELPEVEILVGDMSKFSDTLAAPKAASVEEIDADLYKPKVSTWGVFPRPNNISKTYGGGRTLQPGEKLETAEEKAAKEARTRQLLAAYNSKYGLNIDPKLKSECEKELENGDSLMDLGKLKEAIPFYESVMEKLPFESELHGLAALQWSICQDSLTRHDEARVMYEKLQSHSKPQVSKKARQFYFSFQAMEMMKVKSSSRSPRTTGYQNYFDAFVEDKTNYTLEEDEGGLTQALPYIIFLVSPIFMVFLIATFRSQ
ncbi:hypothetical protein ACS0TY_020026 [Phlomoides rotata]